MQKSSNDVDGDPGVDVRYTGRRLHVGAALVHQIDMSGHAIAGKRLGMAGHVEFRPRYTPLWLCVALGHALVAVVPCDSQVHPRQVSR